MRPQGSKARRRLPLLPPAPQRSSWRFLRSNLVILAGFLPRPPGWHAKTANIHFHCKFTGKMAVRAPKPNEFHHFYPPVPGGRLDPSNASAWASCCTCGQLAPASPSAHQLDEMIVFLQSEWLSGLQNASVVTVLRGQLGLPQPDLIRSSWLLRVQGRLQWSRLKAGLVRRRTNLQLNDSFID